MWTLGMLVVFGGCGAVQPPEHGVGGQLRGLWTGADGVALRLDTGSVNALLTVSSNGTFRFAEQFAPGVSYTVTVATNPSQHTCVVDDGGNGITADSDVTTVSVACTGPAMDIALSGPWGWTFDPTEDTQRFAASVAAQDVAFTVSGSNLSTAVIDGNAATLGEPSEPAALALGSTTVPVALTASGGLSKTYQFVFDRGASILEQMAYGKASNTSPQGGEHFGYAVSLAGDTLAVAADDESSASKGINGDQTQDKAEGAGAVYVFVRSGTTWTQQAYLKASNTLPENQFGYAISLSGDTLAVGANHESSPSTGINGSQVQNGTQNAGAVYVFARSGTTWTQQAYVKASNTGGNDQFGSSVSLSGDTLAVGAIGEGSAATGINGDQADNTAINSGAVYVFLRRGTTWMQQAYVKASNPQTGDVFGYAVSLSGDTLAVGAKGEDSAATGINGSQADNSAAHAGAVYVFVRSGAVWMQQAYLKASNTGAGDLFGYAVSLSGDTLAVGAYSEASAATGIDGDQADDSASGAGTVYVFVRAGTVWTQQAYLKASNTGMADSFGFSVALVGDTLAVGALGEASAATGIGGDQADDSARNAGAVYVFTRSGTVWTQQAYVKASNTGGSDVFGSSVALSGDTLAIGAYGEASPATGINGDQNGNAGTSGAVYVFR